MVRRKNSSKTLPLFAEPSPQPAPENVPLKYLEKNRERIRRWSSKGIHFGTSSWKYPGWKGLIYSGHYPTKKSFEQECLAEYSRVFPTVCADFALYDFPHKDRMQVIHDITADDFKVSLKVTDRITIKRYPDLTRYGAHAGEDNPDFLNVELFEDAFLQPLEALGKKRGAIIFEFAAFHLNSGITYDTYMVMIEDFLSRLPVGFEYAIEIRNREFLTTDYLKMLESHGVAHVLNNWTKMPPIIAQVQLAGVLTGKFSIARALLVPGRTYQEAVELFQPYNEIREENPDLRLGLVEAVRRCIAEGKTLYAYINNRAEGNSPKTIEAILDMLDQYSAEKL